MPAKISQAASAEGVDLRNLQTMLCRARENATRDPAINLQLIARITDLRSFYESIGYGQQMRIPATVAPPPTDLPVVVMPTPPEGGSPARKKAANGDGRKRRTA